MKRFVCPTCGDDVRAIATLVQHRCPSRRSLWTLYEEKDESRHPEQGALL